jgi:hypothetical protein
VHFIHVSSFNLFKPNQCVLIILFRCCTSELNDSFKPWVISCSNQDCCIIFWSICVDISSVPLHPHFCLRQAPSHTGWARLEGSASVQRWCDQSRCVLLFSSLPYLSSLCCLPFFLARASAVLRFELLRSKSGWTRYFPGGAIAGRCWLGEIPGVGGPNSLECGATFQD